MSETDASIDLFSEYHRLVDEYADRIQENDPSTSRAKAKQLSDLAFRTELYGRENPSDDFSRSFAQAAADAGVPSLVFPDVLDRFISELEDGTFRGFKDRFEAVLESKIHVAEMYEEMCS